MNLLDDNMSEVTRLCDRYHVDSLYVFGSILTNNFQDESDIDLLVKFKPMKLEIYADNYFDFKFSLEDLLRRRIDLLEEKVIRNPFLKKSIDSTKQLVYGQRIKGMAV